MAQPRELELQGDGRQYPGVHAESLSFDAGGRGGPQLGAKPDWVVDLWAESEPKSGVMLHCVFAFIILCHVGMMLICDTSFRIVCTLCYI